MEIVYKRRQECKTIFNKLFNESTKYSRFSSIYSSSLSIEFIIEYLEHLINEDSLAFPAPTVLEMAFDYLDRSLRWKLDFPNFPFLLIIKLMEINSDLLDTIIWGNFLSLSDHILRGKCNYIKYIFKIFMLYLERCPKNEIFVQIINYYAENFYFLQYNFEKDSVTLLFNSLYLLIPYLNDDQKFDFFSILDEKLEFIFFEEEQYFVKLIHKILCIIPNDLLFQKLTKKLLNYNDPYIIKYEIQSLMLFPDHIYNITLFKKYSNFLENEKCQQNILKYYLLVCDHIITHPNIDFIFPTNVIDKIFEIFYNSIEKCKVWAVHLIYVIFKLWMKIVIPFVTADFLENIFDIYLCKPEKTKDSVFGIISIIRYCEEIDNAYKNFIDSKLNSLPAEYKMND